MWLYPFKKETREMINSVYVLWQNTVETHLNCATFIEVVKNKR